MYVKQHFSHNFFNEMGNYLKGLVTYNEPPVAETHFTIVLGLNVIQTPLTYLPHMNIML
jgi:hypothetical protein